MKVKIEVQKLSSGYVAVVGDRTIAYESEDTLFKNFFKELKEQFDKENTVGAKCIIIEVEITSTQLLAKYLKPATQNPQHDANH